MVIWLRYIHDDLKINRGTCLRHRLDLPFTYGEFESLDDKLFKVNDVSNIIDDLDYVDGDTVRAYLEDH